MNKYRRVENVELAVKLMGKVQSRSQFWKGFTPEECKLMGAEVEIIRYKAGERIMRTGDQADFVALILSGNARVEVVEPVTGEKRTAGVFGGGSLIGEMALWEGGTRSADVVATGGGISGAGAGNSSGRGGEKGGGKGGGGGGGEDSVRKNSSSSSLGNPNILQPSSLAASTAPEEDDPGETLVAQFHFDEFVDFFLRRPPVAMKLFQVFVQASTSKLKEWRLRTMIAQRAVSQGAGAGAFVGVGGGGAGTGTGTTATAATTTPTVSAAAAAAAATAVSVAGGGAGTGRPSSSEVGGAAAAAAGAAAAGGGGSSRFPSRQSTRAGPVHT
jgi:hypothetical protein